MIRIVIENIFLLCLPTLLYFAYIYLTGTSKTRRQAINDAPFIWLFIAGAALAIGVLSFVADPGSKPGEVYRPAVYRDGKIVPTGRQGAQPASPQAKPSEATSSEDAANAPGSPKADGQ